MTSQLVTSKGDGTEKVVGDWVCRTRRIPLQNIASKKLIEREDFGETKESVGDAVV